MALLHLPFAAWGVAIELGRWTCPLTPLENRLRRLAGDAGYDGGFVEHHLLPVLYPDGLDAGSGVVLAALVVAVNVAIYLPGRMAAAARNARRQPRFRRPLRSRLSWPCGRLLARPAGALTATPSDCSNRSVARSVPRIGGAANTGARRVARREGRRVTRREAPARREQRFGSPDPVVGSADPIAPCAPERSPFWRTRFRDIDRIRGAIQLGRGSQPPLATPRPR
jgi:hypothetical protein